MRLMEDNGVGDHRVRGESDYSFKGREGSLSPLKFYDSLNIYQHFSVKTVIT
jgi:hypothetical protein